MAVRPVSYTLMDRTKKASERVLIKHNINNDCIKEAEFGRDLGCTTQHLEIERHIRFIRV
jgi:hypothetical protein